MFDIIFVVLFMIPAMLGLAELLHILRLRLLKPDNKVLCYKVIILTNDNPMSQMLYEIEKYAWQGKSSALNLIFINTLLEGKKIDECRLTAEKKGFIFCGTQEFKKYLDLI